MSAETITERYRIVRDDGTTVSLPEHMLKDSDWVRAKAASLNEQLSGGYTAEIQTITVVTTDWREL